MTREHTIGNVLWFSAFALLQSIQLLIVAAFILSLIPISLGDFLSSILPFFRDMVRPEREMGLFGFFILANVLICVTGVWSLRDKLADHKTTVVLKRWCLVSAAVLVPQVVAIFSMFIKEVK